MVFMVGPVVTGRGVGENGKAAAVEREPAGDLAEAVRRDSQLDRSTRMGTDGPGLEVTDRGSEPVPDLRRDGARKIDLLRIEIKVDVKVVHLVHVQ